MPINSDWELHSRAQEKVAQLIAYEAQHPRQGADASGNSYDPWRDVIRDPFNDGTQGGRPEIDEARTATLARRAWEGFAWANHRFVLSDERGSCVIVGYNEDAATWFFDNTTPVRLPPEWVAEFVARYLDAVDPERTISGLEDSRELHERIVATMGATSPTVPSEPEIADYLRAVRTQELR